MTYGTLVMGAIALVRGDSFVPEWTMSYIEKRWDHILSVIAFARTSPFGRIGGKAAYSNSAVPAVALTISYGMRVAVWRHERGGGLLAMY